MSEANEKKRLFYKYTLNILFILLLSLHLFPDSLLANGADPSAVIRSASEKVLVELNATPEIRHDPAKLNALIQEHVLPHVDFTVLSRLTLGKYWRQATPEQRSRFVREFKTMLLNTYAAALTRYSNQQIEYGPPKLSSDKRRVTIPTRILADGSQPIAVDYSLRQNSSGWKIYDVSIEGVSLAVNYRTSFSQQIRNYGIDGLIDHLLERNTPAPEQMTLASRIRAASR